VANEQAWLDNPWWGEEEPKSAAQSAYAAATSLESDQAWRRARAILSVALYRSSGYQPGVVTGDPVRESLAMLGPAAFGDSNVNAGLLRSAVDTLTAEIAGRVKPTVKFLTKGADWKTKRRAEGLADWIDAVFRMPQGRYQNLWCLGPELFKDSLIFGEGWAQVSSQCVDTDDTHDITFTRQFPWEMYVDVNEARYGRPRNLFRVTAMPVSEAIRRFVDEADGTKLEKAERKMAILGAEEADDFGQQYRVEKMIKVVEAWRVKRGEDIGRHVIALAGCCLFDEEWEREDFPFVRMTWEQDRIGYYARGMVEQGEALHLEANENLQRFSTRLNLMANLKTFVVAGSVDMSQLGGNEEGQIIEVQPGHNMPVQARPDPIGGSEIAYFDRILNMFYSTLGVSEMKASSRKEPGVDSGVAIRLMNDQQAGRFAVAAEGYERFYVDCAMASIAEARMITAADGSIKVRSEKRGEVDFKSVELPERQVDITSHPASALSTDPAQRIATAQELFGAGLISGATFLRLIQLPDLESELDQQTIQQRYGEWVCSKLLDAETEEDYIAPDDLIPNKPQVMLYVANCYLESILDDAPELNKQLMRRFVSDLDDMITRFEEQKAAAAAPPPGMAPPGAPMPPMPAGPPMQ
jgi:hypothetical protein